jgi:hypothetical protein
MATSPRAARRAASTTDQLNSGPTSPSFPSPQGRAGRLADWAETMEREGLVRLVTYRGKSGITTLLPYLLRDDAGLVSTPAPGRRSVLWREPQPPHASLSVPLPERSPSLSRL